RLRAPDGVQLIRNQLTQLQIALQALPAQEAHPSKSPGELRQLLQASESAHTRQAGLLETARQQWHQTQLAVGRAQVQAETARQEYEKAKAALQDTERQEKQQRYQRQLTEHQSVLTQLRQTLQTLQDNIRESRPDILEQDIRRYQQSADQHEQAHQQRAEQLLRLEVELQTLGARGLDETLADMSQSLAYAKRRANELERRAQALDFLLEKLTTHRRQA